MRVSTLIEFPIISTMKILYMVYLFIAENIYQIEQICLTFFFSTHYTNGTN